MLILRSFEYSAAKMNVKPIVKNQGVIMQVASAKSTETCSSVRLMGRMESPTRKTPAQMTMRKSGCIALSTLR